jgi:hypothetical protein
VRASFNKWWLLSIGILSASALITLGIIVETQTHEVTVDCSGAFANDQSCYQQRYQDLVRRSGVEAAFAELKDEYAKNEFVRANCHQLTHVIGRAAADLYNGDTLGIYAHGDDFCTGGYYHGAMEAFVAEIAPDEMLEKADTLCAEVAKEKHSFHRYDCAHGLGHGFMRTLDNELFESLRACDTLRDEWEKDPCYAGVFMQNVMAADDPSNSSKYLRVDRPLYPCTDVEIQYKATCYRLQSSYALQTQGNNFGKAFGLCATAEGDFRSACYQGLGGYASLQGIQQNTTDVVQNESISTLCRLGEDYEAQSNCSVGAAKQFILHYHSDTQAKTLCDFFRVDVRAACFQAAEEFYTRFQE